MISDLNKMIRSYLPYIYFQENEANRLHHQRKQLKYEAVLFRILKIPTNFTRLGNLVRFIQEHSIIPYKQYNSLILCPVNH